jgi:hypothetical protein
MTVLPPVFSDGGILSASMLNHLLTDLDTLYGWYYGPTYGTDQQQFDATNQATTVEGWAGWVVLNGDALVVQLANFVGSVTATVTFDGVQVGGPYSGVGSYTIPLATGSLNRWQPYRVAVITHRPSGVGELDVVRVYMRHTTTPSLPSLPAFADDDISAASDLNAISDGIRTIAVGIEQPVIGVRGGEEYTLQATNTAWTTVAAWTMQYRVDALRVSLLIDGPDQAGTISARLRHNGTAVNGASWSATSGQVTRVTDQIFPVPGSPVVGNWYTVELQVRQSAGWLTGWFVRPDAIYGDQLGTTAFVETTRWTHGDYGHGDDGTPVLRTLSVNLGTLGGAISTVGSINMVQREPITTNEFPTWPNVNRRCYHVRRWRWLAYSRQEWDSDGPQATLNWTYDGRTWDSYTLPDDEGAGGYYDLDSGPIVTGMTFFVSGAKYAIQTPYTY